MSAPKKKPTRVTHPTDLIPSDLEIVLRIDLSKVRDSLGPDSSEELIKQAALENGGVDDSLLALALSEAEVVWLGLRASDIEAGDRVTVVRTIERRNDDGSPAPDPIVPDPIAWDKSNTAVSGVTRFRLKRAEQRAGKESDRQQRGVPRGGTAAIFAMEPRTKVFVSPIEVASVERVLRKGPDAKRGQPEARGLMSLDYRAQKPSVALTERFASLAGLIVGIVRISAIVEVTGKTLQLEGRIRCRGARAAEKILRFIETIKAATASRPRYAGLLDELEIVREGGVVQLRWSLPRQAVRALLIGDTAESR